MATPRKIEKFNAFQTAYIKWAINKKSTLLQGTVGSGKTLSAVGLYLLLRQQQGGGKMLVVTSRKNAKAFQKANVKKLLLRTLFTQDDLPVFYSGYSFPADIYIISNTFLTRVVLQGTLDQKKALTELLKKSLVLAVDEAHQYQGYKSARTRALKKVTDHYHKLISRDPKNHRLTCITATSVYKELENLHPLFSLLCNPNPLGIWPRFVDRFCIEEEITAYGKRRFYSANGSHSYKDTLSFKKIVGYKNVEELRRIVDPYIFVWDKSDFKFRFNLNYFSLTEPEMEEYRASIRGLGLDKAYAIDIEGLWAYKDRSDVFFLPDKREIRADALRPGMKVWHNGTLASVKGVYEKRVDAGYATRAVKAQQCVSRAEGKLGLLASLIRSQDSGCLVYFNFLDSVEATYCRLLKEFPGRRIVKLTGETKRFEMVVSSINEKDIVLMSSVASQSIDMYIPRLIVAENFGLTPGKIEQLCGRMTRANASYREVSVDFMLREGAGVDTYFYSKLWLRLQGITTNVFVKASSLPLPLALEGIPAHLIDEKFLKERFLWSLS